MASSCLCLFSLAAWSCFILSVRSSSSTCCLCRSSLRLSRASRWGDGSPSLSSWMHVWIAAARQIEGWITDCSTTIWLQTRCWVSNYDISKIQRKQREMMTRLFMTKQLQSSGKWLLNTLNPFLLLLFIWRTDLKAFIGALDNKEAFLPFFIWQRLQQRKALLNVQNQK